jgi:DNA-binding CsgD family transcriptional regulator
MIVLTPRQSEIVEYLKKNPNKKQYQIADEMGLKPSSLYNLIYTLHRKIGTKNIYELLSALEREGYKVEDNTGNPKLTDVQIAKIKELAKTTPRSAIAERFGVCHSTIDNYLKKSHIP